MRPASCSLAQLLLSLLGDRVVLSFTALYNALLIDCQNQCRLAILQWLTTIGLPALSLRIWLAFLKPIRTPFGRAMTTVLSTLAIGFPVVSVAFPMVRLAMISQMRFASCSSPMKASISQSSTLPLAEIRKITCAATTLPSRSIEDGIRSKMYAASLLSKDGREIAAKTAKVVANMLTP